MLCGTACPGSICKPCAKQHFSFIVKTGYDGLCRRMHCPACPHRNVPQERWALLVDEETLELFKQRASKLLSFQCAGCHTRKNLFVEPSPVQAELAPAKISQLFMVKRMYFTNETWALIQDLLKSYIENEVSADGLFKLFMELWPFLFNCECTRCSWTFFLEPLLQGIQDYERNANLHLRYLRQFPNTVTTCCNREHCWVCRTTWDNHQGLTCEEHQAQLVAQGGPGYGQIISCPSCGIQLMKGDGCDSITCVCGHQFRFTDARQQEEE
ncbi:unnamed protein product, partial [Heterosigma akashiwo]